MARGGKSGDWLVAEELFERGDPAFVDAVRQIGDAERLGALAPRWFADRRPEARRLLFDYLDRPLNAFRHEALVKRLFKLAEAAGDDALMARFLVAFDRSIRRTIKDRVRGEFQILPNEQAANELATAWRAQGFIAVGLWRNLVARYEVWGHRREAVVVSPRQTAMPRGTLKETYDPYSWDAKLRRYKTFSVPDWVYALKLNPRSFRKGEPFPEERRKDLANRRLFSIATRVYLRRRAWRYFRRLGRTAPARYVPGVKEALLLYRDGDMASGLALIDNWGLMHNLFRFSPALALGDREWRVAEGRSLAELEPAPRYAALWEAAPRALVDLLVGARCRTVRSWSLRMMDRNPAAVARVFPLEERLGLLGNDDPEVVEFAARLLRGDPELKQVPPARWLDLARTASPIALDVLCELIGTHVAAEQVTMDEAVELAVARPLPMARLGLAWLRGKTPRDEAECRALLGLVEAASEPLRGEILGWARQTLSASPWIRPEWVLAWLDSRYEDVRAEGWRWLMSEPRVRDDVTTWQRLLESPYDDVRLALVGLLESQARDASGGVPEDGQGTLPRLDRGALDPERLRLLWASVLLNIQRGSRAKPQVVRQLVRRVEERPGDLPALLPLLAVALRSVRGPEFRAGLGAVVRLLDRDEHAARLVREAFPELQLV